MSENEMGYRGSKSEFTKQDTQSKIVNFVKEQRVDGSCFGRRPKLRYTLMGGESRYQLKIPSNQINIKNYYCSNSYSNPTLATPSLNPYFVTGFSDAEASFIILILKEQKIKLIGQLKPDFLLVFIKKTH